MTRRHGLLGLAVVAISMVLRGCAEPVDSYRYRLTIEVDTPDGVKSGSSVLETTYRDRRNSWGPHESRLTYWRTKGDAVFVDLGRGRHIIGLLALGPSGNRDPDFKEIIRETFKVESANDFRAGAKRNGRFELAPKLVPTLVTFGDLNTPSSARIIAPSDLPSVFGEGVHFRSAWFERTEDPIVRGIATKLPWLTNFKGTLGGPFDPTWSRPSQNLTGSDFIKGF